MLLSLLTGRRKISLPIHPCVELRDWVSSLLIMHWDGEFSPEESEKLIEDLYSDPTTAAIAEEITRDETMLRSIFSYIKHNEPAAA